MKLNEIMTKEVCVVSPETSLQEVAQKMADRDIGVVPVCDGERILGMATDRDITIRGTAKGVDPKTCKVRDVMSTEVVYTFDDQDVQDAARLMEQRKIRRLVVIDRNKKLCGIVSLGDLAVQTANPLLAGEVVEFVSEPGQSGQQAQQGQQRQHGR